MAKTRKKPRKVVITLSLRAAKNLLMHGANGWPPDKQERLHMMLFPHLSKAQRDRHSVFNYAYNQIEHDVTAFVSSFLLLLGAELDMSSTSCFIDALKDRGVELPLIKVSKRSSKRVLRTTNIEGV